MEAMEGLSFIDNLLRLNAPFMASIPGGLWHADNTGLLVGTVPDAIYCVYQFVTGVDDRGGGGRKIGVKGVYLVKIVGPGSNSTGIETAFDLMDALLDNAVGGTAQDTVYYFLRQQTLIMPQNVNDKLVLSAIGQYRTFLQKIGT